MQAAPEPLWRQAGKDDPPIRLMIVDDSAVARAVLSRMIAAHSDLEVIATASNANEALETLRSTRVDIVLLDVEMPGTSGLEALPEILRRGEGARVLIVSSLCEDGAEATVRALALGAADTLPKPGTNNFGGRFSDVLAERLRRIGRVEAKQPEALGKQAAPAKPLPLRPLPDGPLRCLALGASTGGLHALSEFLRALPPRIGAPILITQHLPAVFMPFFARQIEAAAGRTARVAVDRALLINEEILLAPGDAHLCVERHGATVRVELNRDSAESGCMPSVDPMLAATAAAYGETALAVIFSGMGRDGLAGSRALIEAGGAVLTQDKASSAVWGMPRVVAEAGLASAVLPPEELAACVAARASGAPWN
jgi:two-component system chemotaxis response regulator CheB